MAKMRPANKPSRNKSRIKFKDSDTYLRDVKVTGQGKWVDISLKEGFVGDEFTNFLQISDVEYSNVSFKLGGERFTTTKNKFNAVREETKEIRRIAKRNKGLAQKELIALQSSLMYDSKSLGKTVMVKNLAKRTGMLDAFHKVINNLDVEGSYIVLEKMNTFYKLSKQMSILDYQQFYDENESLIKDLSDYYKLLKEIGYSMDENDLQQISNILDELNRSAKEIIKQRR